MNKTITYLFDPLCGWCYGATAAVSDLASASEITLELLPTGLFSDEGAKLMDDDFAAYAWSNDQRIAGLTGQNFTERYRTLVLADRKQLFDSGPATLALTAVYLTAPTRELETLKAIQHVRFVEGKDITKQHTLISVLKALGLDAAASLVENSDTELLKASSIRTKRAQAVMREFNARGVPTFIASSGQMRWILDTNEMYSNPNALISQLKAA